MKVYCTARRANRRYMRDLKFERETHAAAGAIFEESRIAVPGASSVAPAGGRPLDQHISRVSKFLLPLVTQPPKVGPVPLFRARSRSTSSKLTSARFSSTITRSSFHGWCLKPSLSSSCNWRTWSKPWLWADIGRRSFPSCGLARPCLAREASSRTWE